MADQNDHPTPIRCAKVLAVEGKDEVNFFEKFLKDLSISDYQIKEVGGKNQFPNKLPPLLKSRGFEQNVTHLVVVRDKDEDDAFDSITKVLKDEGFTPPSEPGKFSEGNPKVGVFLMPGDTVEGNMLEDLCLKSVENDPAMGCVNQFESCVLELDAIPKNIPKAKVQIFRAQAFLAEQEEIVSSVGLGAQKSYWNFSSSCFDELKKFLCELK